MTRRQMKSQNVEKKLEIFFTHTYTFSTRHTKNSVDVSCYCAIIGFEFVPFLHIIAIPITQLYTGGV